MFSFSPAGTVVHLSEEVDGAGRGIPVAMYVWPPNIKLLKLLQLSFGAITVNRSTNLVLEIRPWLWVY